MNTKRCYLIPSPIGRDDAEDHMNPSIIRALQASTIIITEHAKTARQFLKTCRLPQLLETIEVIEYRPKHMGHEDTLWITEKIRHVDTFAIMSDAGLPCIADPGGYWVMRARELGFDILPLSGPSSIYLALMGSGLNGQQFAFNGYLPVKEDELKRQLLHQMRQVEQYRQTQICIETPYRNRSLLQSMLKYLPGTIYLCVAINLLQRNQQIVCMRVSEWKQSGISLSEGPCVFLFGIEA
jgi:16S rRNA (cytidine1402-2'-O)-methyltransferase